MEEVAVETDAWVFLLKLLHQRPDSRTSGKWWMNGCLSEMTMASNVANYTGQANELLNVVFEKSKARQLKETFCTLYTWKAKSDGFFFIYVAIKSTK